MEEKPSIPQASQRLSMSAKTLAHRVEAARRGELNGLGTRQRPLTESEQEWKPLRREPADVKMERDI
jgi:hypothetical protein